MSTTNNMTNEFLLLAVEDLRIAGSELTLPNQHHVLIDWCEIYEDVPPRNRAETVVRDALNQAREHVAQTMRENTLAYPTS